MKGVFIVISGTDGSGKGTQCLKLRDYLEEKGHKVDVFDFPRYGNKSAKLVELYLNGVFGSADDVSAKVASAFFAYDRFAASEDMKKALNAGHIVLSNRYVSANMGHQGGKINDAKERLEFFQWLDKLEYEHFGIPRPTLNIFLHVPYLIGQQLVLRKQDREYIKDGKKQDIHEADANHLRMAEEAYLQIARTFDGWHKISCVKDPGNLTDVDNIKTIDDISKDIIEVVENLIDTNKN